MCGIAGVLAAPGFKADREVLERMVGRLQHRGPDALGFHLDGALGLGVARLRIVDLATGDQPMGNEDGSVQVAFNGEIYNHVALREELSRRGHRFRTRADTEVIAHAWEEHRERCVEAFNGMFALAIWDAPRRQLFLARDRMGEKPLYYAITDEGLVFGSELRALLAHPGVSGEIDPDGVSRYLAYDCVPDPDSMIRGVAKLPPGHTLTISDGAVTIRRYWDVTFHPDIAPDAIAWQYQIRRGFDDAVRLRLGADVPLGCFLSGGIDSTAVVTTAAQLRSGLRTFSVGYADSPYDERRFARLVADRFGTVHEELIVSAADAGGLLARLGEVLDEPIADMSFVPLHLLSCAARRTVTVALTGDGGDELFAGYPSMGAQWWHDGAARLPRRARTALARFAERGHTPEPVRRFLLGLDLPAAARNQVLVGGLPPATHSTLLAPAVREAARAFDAYADLPRVLEGCGVDDRTSRLIYQYCKVYLAGQNLVNADRASMAASLELRAPFLDHTFVELTTRIPSALKLLGLRRLKQLLKRALADRLPSEILARGKQGFGVPFGAWFRGPLSSFLRRTLSIDAVRASGVFDAAVVSSLVAEHVGGRRDHTRVLWSILIFELWQRAHRR